jgi:hypothetical protein
MSKFSFKGTAAIVTGASSWIDIDGPPQARTHTATPKGGSSWSAARSRPES